MFNKFFSVLICCFQFLVVTMNFISLSLFHQIASILPPEIFIITEIFKYKSIFNVVNFHCNNAGTENSIQKMFMANNILSSSFEIDQNSSYDIPYHYQNIGIVVNASCDNWPTVLDNFKAENIFKNPFKWYIVAENFNSTVHKLLQYPIEIDSDVTIIQKMNNGLFNFYEFYNTGYFTNGQAKVAKIGHWSSSLYMEIRRRVDLSGVKLKCMVVVTSKVVNETFEAYLERSRLSKTDTLHKKKFFTLLKYLRDMYNISYELHRTNSWGYLRNGSFDGMIGALQRNEMDIGGAPVLFRLERAKVIDATAEVWPSRPMFILRHPKHPSGYYTIFTRPLTDRVWYCIIAILTISGTVLVVMVKMRVLNHPGDDGDVSPSFALLTIWSAVCQQGTTLSKSSTSVKLVIFVTFLFTLTIYQYYNATVVSTLLRDPPKNIRTAQDLLNSNLKVGVDDVLYNRDFFARTTDPIALQLYKKKIVTPERSNFYTLEKGMALVKKGGFAFLVDTAIAYGIMRHTFDERELCDAHEITLYPPEKMVSIVRKGSPYKEHFAYGIRKMFESGLLHRIKSQWDEPRPRCVRSADTFLVAVTILEFSMPLAVLVAGAVAAFAVLGIELAICGKRRATIPFRH